MPALVRFARSLAQYNEIKQAIGVGSQFAIVSRLLTTNRAEMAVDDAGLCVSRVSRARARARDIEIPEPARALPDDAFHVEAQLVPITIEVAPEVFDFLATETFHAAVDTHWTLTRDASRAGAAVLEVAPVGSAEGRLNLDVRALLPQPESVTSTPFDVPRGASVTLGYGLAAAGGPPTRFRATLRCGSVETTLADETVTPPDATWHGTTRELPSGRGCTLRLDTATSAGAAARAAAWARPPSSAARRR